ncbi:hypothetical protein Aperf_G00000050380 [Anoplocephala perfoliata]
MITPAECNARKYKLSISEPDGEKTGGSKLQLIDSFHVLHDETVSQILRTSSAAIAAQRSTSLASSMTVATTISSNLPSGSATAGITTTDFSYFHSMFFLLSYKVLRLKIESPLPPARRRMERMEREEREDAEMGADDCLGSRRNEDGESAYSEAFLPEKIQKSCSAASSSSDCEIAHKYSTDT